MPDLAPSVVVLLLSAAGGWYLWREMARFQARANEEAEQASAIESRLALRLVEAERRISELSRALDDLRQRQERQMHVPSAAREAEVVGSLRRIFAAEDRDEERPTNP